MPQFNHYQRGTREATVSYTPESPDAPYIVLMYVDGTLMDRLRTDTKPYAAKIAQQWVACKR